MDQKFIDLPEEPGFDLHSKCRSCGEVIPTTDEAKAGHTCPPSAEQAREADFKQYIAGLWATIGDPATPLEELRKAIDAVDRAEKEHWEFQLGVLEKHFPQEELRQMVYRAIMETLDFVRRYRDKEYAKQDELRSQGVPYAVRIKEFNRARIEFCDKREAELLHDVRMFRVRPMRDWLRYGDLDFAARMKKTDDIRVRMEWIIRFNLEGTYWVPKK